MTFPCPHCPLLTCSCFDQTCEYVLNFFDICLHMNGMIAEFTYDFPWTNSPVDRQLVTVILDYIVGILQHMTSQHRHHALIARDHTVYDKLLNARYSGSRRRLAPDSISTDYCLCVRDLLFCDRNNSSTAPS